MIYGIVDRIENGTAIIIWDDGRKEERPAGSLSEGTAVYIGDDGELKENMRITEERRINAERRRRKLFKRK